MAEAGGKKVVAMTQVQELSSSDQAVAYASNDMKQMAVMEMDSADTGTSLMPGQVDVEAEVSVTFSIE